MSKTIINAVIVLSLLIVGSATGIQLGLAVATRSMPVVHVDPSSYVFNDDWATQSSYSVGTNQNLCIQACKSRAIIQPASTL